MKIDRGYVDAASSVFDARNQVVVDQIEVVGAVVGASAMLMLFCFFASAREGGVTLV